jgi:hypothetical protein
MGAKTKDMKKITYTALMLVSAFSVMFSMFSCNDYETYADKKKSEKKAIERFLADNNVCGHINVISEAQFRAQDNTTNVDNNEYVLFEDDGVYMQIINRGTGRTFPEMSKDFADSTVNKVVLCRFTEYDIMSGDTTNSNFGVVGNVVDKMLINYSHLSRSYSGSFTSGMMYNMNASSSVGNGVAVPSGWMKPFDVVRLSRGIDDLAHVRIIVPHSSGTSNASYYVHPYYYDITYQLGI